MMSFDVLTISQLNFYIKSIFDGDSNLSNVFVQGEISNFTDHVRTGHLYMTLKDESACVKAVMFKTSALRLKFRPQNGMSVIARGNISVFEKEGQYQLYVDDMQPYGSGALSIAFEQLKEKLQKEGLFDIEHKKPIPVMPQKIGVITSPKGAVLNDIISVLGRRFPVAEIILYPVQVQGDAAPIQIAQAIEQMSDSNASDVIIIGRGGGSAEDLCAFNDEEVARAVFNCRTPIISAVGHETDYTICDFTADLRAPTPSAAAELAVPDKSELKNRIDSSISLIYTSVFEKVYTQKNITKLITSSLNTEIPKKLINFRRIVLDEHIKTIMDSEVLSIREKRHNLGSLSGKLDAMSPFKVMARGYSITTNMNGTLINSIDNIDIDDKICIQLLNGKINCVVDGIERLNK